MKKSRFLSFTVIVLLLSSFLQVHSQKLPMKYGKIDPVYFEMKAYDKDTSAEALILGDYGESSIIYDQNDGWVVNYSRHCRAKVFKKEGYFLADQNFLLYHTATGKEKIVMLKGTVYNLENGKVVESDLDKSMIFSDIIDSKRTEQKFTLPNVREGSILEFAYEVRSDFWSLPDWRFQYSIPALWSEYRVNYPEYFTFKKLQKGYLNLDVSETSTKPIVVTLMESERNYVRQATVTQTSTNQYHYNDNFYRWIKNDVPAFKEEPFMNASINYRTAIELELSAFNPPSGLGHRYTQTWEDINKDLLNSDDFGLQIKRGGFLKDNAENIKASCKDSVRQIIAAYELIRNAMKWDGRNRVFTSQGLRNAFDKKSGSSADINLMLVTLLKELGFNSNPVILSTRDNGIVHPAQIMTNQFNYVIASVSAANNTYLLDATEKGCPYNLLPSRCMNGQGRLIAEKNPGWVDLNNNQRYEIINMMNGSIESDGRITGKLQRLYGKYAALSKRSEIKNKGTNEEYVSYLESSSQGLTIKECQLVGIDSLSQPLQENLQVEISDFALVTGNIISLSPLFNDEWTDNPFKLEDRKFPVDFTYPHYFKDVINYTIPEGYTIDEKPADLVISLPDGKTKFSYRISITGNQLQLLSILDIGKILYINDEYPLLKEFFVKMVNKRGEKIVLKKSI